LSELFESVAKLCGLPHSIENIGLEIMKENVAIQITVEMKRDIAQGLESRW
jgi:hypothetical protein